MPELLNNSERLIYLSRVIYLIFNASLAFYLMFFKGPEIFGIYSLVTIQVAFFSYLSLHGLPNIIQYKISNQEKINSFYFMPSLLILLIAFLLISSNELVNSKAFYSILLGSISSTLINIYTIGKKKYLNNLLFVFFFNIWILVVMVFDQFIELNISNIFTFWGLNSLIMACISMIYIYYQKFLREVFFNYDLKGLINVISNIFIGLPYELFRFLERNYFSFALSEVLFGVYSFFIYIVSSFQGVFIRSKNQILINKLKKKASDSLIRLHQKEILHVYAWMIIPYVVFLAIGIKFYELVKLNHVLILILPFLYNLFYNNSTSYLVYLSLFDKFRSKLLLCLSLSVAQSVMFGVAVIFSSSNITFILVILYFILFNFIARKQYRKLIF